MSKRAGGPRSGFGGAKKFQGHTNMIATTPNMAKALKRGNDKPLRSKQMKMPECGYGLDLSAQEYLEKIEEHASRVGREKRIAQAIERQNATGKSPKKPQP